MRWIMSRFGWEPTPRLCLVAQLFVDGQWVTSITRLWRSQRDTRFCRLCPRCKAVKGVCLVMVNTYVAPEDASSLDLAELTKDRAKPDVHLAEV